MKLAYLEQSKGLHILSHTQKTNGIVTYHVII